MVSAGAYLPPDLQQAWEDLGVVVLQGYGATECGPAVGQHRASTIPRASSAGRCHPVRLRLDPETSEILVAGPTVTPGLLADPEATAAAIDPDGWYHTGDIGHLDDQGRLVLSGRIKNIIVLPNGLNVFPEDIEAVLADHGISQSVVLETAPGRIEAVVLPPGTMPIVAPGRGGQEERDAETGCPGPGGHRAHRARRQQGPRHRTSASTPGGCGRSPTSRAPTPSRSGATTSASGPRSTSRSRCATSAT